MLIVRSLLFGVLIAGLSYRNHYFQSAEESQASSAHYDDGTAAVASATFADLIASASEATWTPKINDAKPNGSAPAGMVWTPGDHFWRRTGAPHMSDTSPWLRVYVDDFWMDRTEVTNEQFAKFEKATSHVTVAELKPRAEDYPGARPENLVAGSGVFTTPKSHVSLNDYLKGIGDLS